jgi:hypothetical protein
MSLRPHRARESTRHRSGSFIEEAAAAGPAILASRARETANASGRTYGRGCATSRAGTRQARVIDPVHRVTARVAVPVRLGETVDLVDRVLQGPARGRWVVVVGEAVGPLVAAAKRRLEALPEPLVVMFPSGS